jgi:hypothetical protein
MKSAQYQFIIGIVVIVKRKEVKLNSEKNLFCKCLQNILVYVQSIFFYELMK